MIEPGAVFEIPAALAQPPQVATQPDPPMREGRWVVVIANKRDCRDNGHATVHVVLLSAQVEYAGRHDILLKLPDGGLKRDSIAQTDLTFVVLKRDLTPDRRRGVLQADTLRQIRAKVAETLGL